MLEREINMWRFSLGVAVGIALTFIVLTGLPFKWNADPERQIINQAHDKFIIIVGVDEKMDFSSLYRISEYKGNQRIIHIFKDKENADKLIQELVVCNIRNNRIE